MILAGIPIACFCNQTFVSIRNINPRHFYAFGKLPIYDVEVRRSRNGQLKRAWKLPIYYSDENRGWTNQRHLSNNHAELSKSLFDGILLWDRYQVSIKRKSDPQRIIFQFMAGDSASWPAISINAGGRAASISIAGSILPLTPLTALTRSIR